MSLADETKRWEKVTEPFKWNPRYVLYARYHGMTPEAVYKRDDTKYPGGRMTGFLLWISEMEEAFHRTSPESFFPGMHGGRGNIVDFAAWDKFLEGVVISQEIATEIIAEEKWTTLDNGLTPD